MCSVAVSWESTVPAVILNCFAKCGFDTMRKSALKKKTRSEWSVPVISRSF
jgi:hypothetical protein